MPVEESKIAETTAENIAPNEVNDDVITVDMAQAEQILFYQDAPISGPDWLKDAAQSKANFAQRLPGVSEWTIGNGVGSLGQLTREEAAEKEREDTAEWFESFVENVEQASREEREREEWANTRHSRFGADLTGNEWGELADMIGADGPARERLIKRLMEQGKSKADAEKKAADMADVYRLMAKPESQLTEAEKAKLDAADSDPDFKANTAWLADQRKGEAYGNERKSEIELVSANSSRTTSVAARDDAFSVPAFANAPDMAGDFKAVAANVPPAAVKPPAPAVVAQITTPVAPIATPGSGGFDLS